MCAHRAAICYLKPARSHQCLKGTLTWEFLSHRFRVFCLKLNVFGQKARLGQKIYSLSSLGVSSVHYAYTQCRRKTDLKFRARKNLILESLFLGPLSSSFKYFMMKILFRCVRGCFVWPKAKLVWKRRLSAHTVLSIKMETSCVYSV